MTNVIDIIAKHLDEIKLGVYDQMGTGGNIFGGRLKNTENNQIILNFQTTEKFIGHYGGIGELKISVYNRNYNSGVAKLKEIANELDGKTIKSKTEEITLFNKQELLDIDVKNETNLHCIQSIYTIKYNF